MSYSPTAEQLEALRLFETGKSLAIEAGAGAGKTSTLVLLAKSTKRKGQYIAFNKAIVEEAGTKFPATVACSTAHSLAYKAIVGEEYASRLRNSRRVKPMELAAILKLNPMTVTTFAGEQRTLGAGFLASLALRGVTRFCQSGDTEPLAKHVPFVEGLDTPRHEQHGLSAFPVNAMLAKSLVPTMKKAWADLQRYDGALPFKHDHYLKMWQLSGPVIDAEFILFDEAQDANPVLQAVVSAQAEHGKQLVWVGDSQQQIYSFTGAVNALQSVSSDARTFLTQSFRFGPGIAQVANDVLDRLNAELRIVGSGGPSVVEEIDEPDVLLTRTNATAVRAMLEAQKEGKKVHLVGGSAEIAKFVRAAKDLMEGRRVDHPELACFVSWDEVCEYVDSDEDGGDLRLLVNLVNEFDADVVLAAVGAASQERHADLVISTAHKSKGREWDAVKLGNDFPEGDKAKDEELRLLYVAVTRARKRLDVTMVATLNEGVKSAADAPLVAPRETVKRKPSEHVGREGGTLDLEVTVEGAIPLETRYGAATLYKMRDADGNIVKWITSKDEYEEGDVLSATWQVKQHGEFRGEKETTVTRPAGLTVRETTTA